MSREQSSSLSASIVATLKERIIAWQYPPEYRITEEGLCREFGVSRSPVREALRMLVTGGFVQRMSNRGYAIKQVNLRDVEELYAVRLALELFVVEALAARGLASEPLVELKRKWSAVRRKPKRKGEELAALDAQFHETLAQALGNATLLQQLKTINERLFVFRLIDFDKANRVGSTCVQHLKILERIAARDPEGARKAMRRNIEEGRTIVHTAIKDALARAFAL
ncbi:MAG TPA: GntR family transcriptional regulator [Candidatus Cybelea sp.]|nr:GntR family transcriptional regulator [Candidatus Cybelea sp.]